MQAKHLQSKELVNVLQQCTIYFYHSIKSILIRLEHYEALADWELYAEIYGKSSEDSAFDTLSKEIANSCENFEDYIKILCSTTKYLHELSVNEKRIKH
jgi:hypothetical protein